MTHGFHTMLSFSTTEAYYSTGVYTSAMLFEMFLFGLYAALFGACLHILLRKRRSLQKAMLAAIVTMFGLAAGDVIWGILNMHWFILKKSQEEDDDDDDEQPEIPIKIMQYKFLLYITSNIIADTLLIYRCYTLWNNNIRIIILPCIVLLGATICGYLFVGLSDDEYPFRFLLSIFLFSTLALNVLVTSLMAGRIWWIARRTQNIMGPKLTKKYRTAIAIFVESGILYSIYVILDVILHALLLDAGLVQIVGLVPTLMIVQIGMNHRDRKGQRTTSISNLESRAVTNTDFMCEAHTTPPMSPISIPAPPYRVDSVERYHNDFPASPSSDETRIGDIP